jgi:hypothetical protein
MAHATVGYLFNGNPENGGEGLLIGLNRCQAFKVAQRNYKGKGGRGLAEGAVVVHQEDNAGIDVTITITVPVSIAYDFGCVEPSLIGIRPHMKEATTRG